MKRILPVLFALIFSFSVKAQTPLTEAVNFNSVALNGEHIDLFEKSAYKRRHVRCSRNTGTTVSFY